MNVGRSFGFVHPDDVPFSKTGVCHSCGPINVHRISLRCVCIDDGGSGGRDLDFPVPFPVSQHRAPEFPHLLFGELLPEHPAKERRAILNQKGGNPFAGLDVHVGDRRGKESEPFELSNKRLRQVTIVQGQFEPDALNAFASNEIAECLKYPFFFVIHVAHAVRVNVAAGGTKSKAEKIRISL